MQDDFKSSFMEILNRSTSKGKSFDELIDEYNADAETPINHEEALKFFINSKQSMSDLPSWFAMRLSEMRMSAGWED